MDVTKRDVQNALADAREKEAVVKNRVHYPDSIAIGGCQNPIKNPGVKTTLPDLVNYINRKGGWDEVRFQLLLRCVHCSNVCLVHSVMWMGVAASGNSAVACYQGCSTSIARSAAWASTEYHIADQCCQTVCLACILSFAWSMSMQEVSASCGEQPA